MDSELTFRGFGELAGTEWVPDVDLDALDDVTRPQPRNRPRLHLFDWCAPGRSKAQHDKCPGSYDTRRDLNHGRGAAKWQTVTVRCECPRCNHDKE